METAISTAKDNNQMQKLISGVIWRNAVAGLVAKVRHKTAWLLRPRHIPKHPIGNRRRKGHVSSVGRRMSSSSCHQVIVYTNLVMASSCNI